MIRLDSTVSLQCVLAGAVATTQPQVTVCASDQSATGYAGLAPIRTALNSTTDVTILAAPATLTIRDVDYLGIFNRDTASITVTIKYDASGTDTIITTFTLLTLETLLYIHGTGWITLAANGALKTTSAATGILAAVNGGTGFGSYAVGDMLCADTTTTLAKLADVAVGSYLRSGGVGIAPLWSTATLPNTATTGDLLYASAANIYSNLAGVATGNALISGGVGVPPSWGKIGLTTHVSEVLSRANGGTEGFPFSIPGGRLTLTSATPVMTADATAQTTIYYALYTSDQVPLYNGTNWFNTTFTELSQTTTDTTKSPAAVANNSNYDMFIWTDTGTIRCTRGPAWASDTARGTGAGSTELVRQNGVLLNNVAITNGPGAKRGTYVGTVRSNGTASIDWIGRAAPAAGGGAAFLYVWNMYNRVIVSVAVKDSTDSWTYGTAAFRSANNSTANRASIVRGLDEDIVSVFYNCVTNPAVAGSTSNGIGLDSTTAFNGFPFYNGNAAVAGGGTAFYIGQPGFGLHFFQEIESSNSGTNSTFYGDGGSPLLLQSGISLTTPC